MTMYTYTRILVIVFLTSTTSQETQGSVSLSCALSPPTVYLLQRVIFNCTVSHTGLLEWISPDYIGENPLQIVADDSSTAPTASPVNPNTIARLLNFNQTTISSSLEIIVSLLHNSTVTCRNVGTRDQEILPFSGVDNVDLTGPLKASFGEEVIFTCIVRGSGLLVWSSPIYIEDSLVIVADDHTPAIVPSHMKSNIFATRLSHTVENGAPVIVSELHVRIITQELFTTTVVCHNTALKSNKVIHFETVTTDSNSSATTAATEGSTTLRTSSSVPYVASPFILFPVLLSARGLDLRVNN